MFGPGRARFEGEYAHVRGAYNVPKGLQSPRIPIIVGGNGEKVTAGYAIKYADELNFVFLEPDEIAERIVAVRARCETEGRDPATLRFSLYARDEEMREAGQERVDLLGAVRGGRPGPDRLLPDPLVADRGGPGGLRRGLPRRGVVAQRLTVDADRGVAGCGRSCASGP